MEQVKVGIIGIGNMGSYHASLLFNGEVKGAKLTAVCDSNKEKIEQAKKEYGKNIEYFTTAEDFYNNADIDAALVATPHYDHSDLVIEGFKHNLHVLTEKPAGVYTKQVEKMNDAAKASDKVFGIMFNQRTNPVYRKVKEMLDNGELGELKRVVWIITDWYRPQSYYNSGGWRATWAGEGGGVLLNQDPHQLDLLQWLCGMPIRVRSFMEFGQYHDIEVEDDVTAFMEYENGAKGVFITSTGEAPGTNRLEISGDMGKIVVENDCITFWRNTVSERVFNDTYEGGFGAPDCWECKIPIEGDNTQHKGILQNWINVIKNGGELLAPGEEGINGLTLSNAMHLSEWTDSWVKLPIDGDKYYEELKKRIEQSTLKKKQVKSVKLDVNGTY